MKTTKGAKIIIVKPWSKEVERVFRELQRNRAAYTNNLKISREIGRYCPELIDNDFIDLAPSKKKRRYWVTLLPDKAMVPIYPPSSRHDKFIKFKFYKIF